MQQWQAGVRIAQMVKLVDTLASGASARKGVEVQVLFWAPLIRYTSPIYTGSKPINILY
jgi:hypothetical protein